MASQLTEAMIVNGVVLVTVLASDLGRARKIGWLRIMRPLIAAAVIVPLFVITPVGHGTGLTIEFAGLAAGVLCGLGAGALMRVYRHPATGKPVSCVGAGYALLWLLIIGARTTFSYGAAHWFAGPLVRWAIANDVSAAALTDGLIFMAVAMVVMRAISLGVRAVRLAGTGLSAEPASGPAGER